MRASDTFSFGKLVLPRRPKSSAAVLGLVALALLTTSLSVFVLSRLGMAGFTLLLGGLLAFALLMHISQKDLSILLMLWLMSMSAFRMLGMVKMPALPDFSFDRLFLAIMFFFFMLRLITWQRRLAGPYYAEAFLILHTVYVLFNLLFMAPQHFHAWVLSNLSPLFAFLVGRYMISNGTVIRNLIIFFLIISIYYYVESIAQHFGWNWLIWPKTIINAEKLGLWQPGRSRGPVLHPPLFGQLQAMLLLVHVFLLTRPLHRMLKLLVSLSLAASLLGLYFAYTRAPYFALGAGLLTFGIMCPRSRRPMVVGIVLIALLQAVFSFNPSKDEFLQERLQTTGTFENRLMMVANSIRIVQDYPVFGVGVFKAREYLWIYNRGTEIPFYGYVKRHFGGTGEMVPHDIYISRIAEEGLVSALLLLGFAIVVWRAFGRKWRQRPTEAWFNRDVLALFAAIEVAYLVGGMAIDYRYFDFINALAFLIAGIVVGYGGASSRMEQRSVAMT